MRVFVLQDESGMLEMKLVHSYQARASFIMLDSLT